MSDKEKNNNEQLQKTKKSNVQKKEENTIHNRLEELRRWFETQGGCE